MMFAHGHGFRKADVHAPNSDGASANSRVARSEQIVLLRARSQNIVEARKLF